MTVEIERVKMDKLVVAIEGGVVATEGLVGALEGFVVIGLDRRDIIEDKAVVVVEYIVSRDSKIAIEAGEE
jgi:hypothetical protein